MAVVMYSGGRRIAINQKVKINMASGSFIRKMFEDGIALKQKYGNDKVFDLSIGNPIMEPPAEVKQEIRRLSENPIPGMHRYMENVGYTNTRAAVAAQLAIDTGIKFTTSEIAMSAGTAGALNCVFKALLNPGEEVITFAPYFFEYDFYVDNHGGIIKIVPSDENFVPRFDLLEAAITPKTKAVIINSPNNPTGTVYSHETLEKITEILRAKSRENNATIYAVSDDVYCRVIFDGIKCPRMINHYENTIIVTSFSKDLALPGERIGYSAVHPDCIDRKDVVGGIVYAIRILGYVGAPAFQQNLVRNIQNVTVPTFEYQKKRDFLYTNLTRMGYRIVKPQGAFYLFPQSPIKDDIAFIYALKDNFVLTVPGSSFKAPGHFRISYCTDDHNVEGCLDGFEKVAKQYNLQKA
jgi:aspartate aminotransferase